MRPDAWSHNLEELRAPLGSRAGSPTSSLESLTPPMDGRLLSTCEAVTFG